MISRVLKKFQKNKSEEPKDNMDKEIHSSLAADSVKSHQLEQSNGHLNHSFDHHSGDHYPHFNRNLEPPHMHHGHLNHAYEQSSKPTSRKVSAASHVDEGPVRKKSFMHKSNSDKALSVSAIDSHSNCDENESPSIWYDFCLKINSPEESRKQYQPEIWKRVCPQPYCPSYRKVTRIIALTLIGLLAWCVLYAIVGESAAPPKGQLFQLIVLSISAHFGGWLFGLTTLPALVGMLFTGIALQNLNIVNIDSSFSHLNKHLSAVALVIILTRAGLDLDPTAVNRLKFTVLKLSVIPWTAEACLTVILAKFWLGTSWKYSILLGSIIAAVAPAVVVPCLFRLRSKGYGVVKGIPTLIIAVAGIDDALSVAIFGVVLGIIFTGASVAKGIIFGSLSILAGIGIGVIWGIICNITPERNDPFASPLRILLLLSGGLAGVFGSELVGYGGAGPLICVTAAFVALTNWSKQGWHVEENPAALAFEIFWMIFQPILFGITGSRIKINEMDGNVVLVSLGILAIVVVVRIAVTILVGIGCNMNLKEKLFVSVSWISKGIVQAALGPVALSLLENKRSDEVIEAQKIMQCCILSIILTAPTGALLTTILGPILLTKEKPLPPELRVRKKSRRQSFLSPDLLLNEDANNEDREQGHNNITITSIVEEEKDDEETVKK
ncbi:sodium/hydrogen exchanger 9B2 isoform X2 [Diabrotica virgifera virgifera]|uniref:Cation/H+ exchanger transmembrane domain-containing protein n=1 Tax=Diabrotica virgifera virgifera TaxID=50390 RepID=A0ABM5KG57_DIAVI|nr:sodium/hydrogen exchanger 9B2 isoform X2 [Diabrotica virgifera virgifera]